MGKKCLSFRIMIMIVSLICAIIFLYYQLGHEWTTFGLTKPGIMTRLSEREIINQTTAASVASNSWSLSMNFNCRTYELEYCQMNNIVKDRGDDVNKAASTVNIRPYSISQQTFQALESSHESICESVNDTMHAIAAGKRRWLLDTTRKVLPNSLERETIPSYFVPANCNLPPLPGRQLCDVMNQYSHIITIGDSLTRHLRQAFFMALMGNMIIGGMVQPNNNVNPDQFYECRCDGQFSEHVACRSLGGVFGNLVDPRDYHVCSHLPIDKERFHFSQDWDDTVALSRCDTIAEQEINNSPSRRGILLILQGGVHFDSNPIRYEESLDTFFQQPGFIACLQSKQIHIIWTTYNAQSQLLDAQYPHQSRDSASAFNAHVISYLHEQPFPIYILDQYNLTMDAQTSDGFHYLSDVNLLKVYFIVHLASRLKQEQELQWLFHNKTQNQTEQHNN